MDVSNDDNEVIMRSTTSMLSLPEDLIYEVFHKIRDPWDARALTLALGDRHVPRHENSGSERATVRHVVLQRRLETGCPTVERVYGSFVPSFLLDSDERREIVRAAMEVHLLLPPEWTADESLFDLLSKNHDAVHVFLRFQNVFSAALVAHVVAGNPWFTHDGKGARLMHLILEISISNFSRRHSEVFTWAFANLCEAFMYYRVSGRPYSSNTVRGISDVFALFGQRHQSIPRLCAVSFLCDQYGTFSRGPSIVSSIRSVLTPESPDDLLRDWFLPVTKSVLKIVSSLRVLLNAVLLKMPEIRPSASRWIATRFIPSFRTHGTRVRALRTLYRAVYRTTRGCRDDFFRACDVARCLYYETIIPDVDEDHDSVSPSSVHSVCSAFFSEEALRFVAAWRSILTLSHVDRALSLFGECCRSDETDGRNHDRLKSALHFLIARSQKENELAKEPYALAVMLVYDTLERSIVHLSPPPPCARLFMEAVRLPGL